MRILHVTRELHEDRRYGLGRSLDPVLQALQQAGHELSYLTQEQLGQRARELQQRWVRRLLPLARWLFGVPGELQVHLWLERLNMGRLAAHVAAKTRADIVHLHDPWIGWGFRIGRLIYGARSSRWGITQHGFGCYTDAIREEGVPYTARLTRLNRRMEASVLRAADWVVCPTAAARAQLARDMGLPEIPAHWQVVPHAQPQLALPSRAAARQQLGWRSEDWHVLAVGRINPVKRMELVVRVCLQMGRTMRLTILGPGDASALHALVDAEAGAKLQLEVLTVDDVTPYLAAADVYVSTSLNESFGIANLEALAAGVPAICTAVGGVPEVTGGSAWLLPPAEPALGHALRRALRELQDSPQQRRHWADAGARHARQWPDAQQVAQRYEAIYLYKPWREPIAQAALAEPPAPELPLCALPVPLQLDQAQRVLVFAPHPDDEAIGCGGALALLARAGVPVRVVLVSDGSGAGELPPGTDQIRQREFVTALQRLGISDYALLGFPDGGLKLEAPLLQAIRQQVDEFQPGWVFGPSSADLHRDHRVVAQALRQAACANANVQRLYEYETWSPLPVTHVLDISAVLDDKLAALSEHRTALAYGNYLEATVGLARHRGLLLGGPRPGAAGEAYLCSDRSTSFAWRQGWGEPAAH